VFGVVAEEGGELLEGADVELIIHATGRSVHSCVTDAAGRFELTLPADAVNSQLDLRASKAGYSSRVVPSVRVGAHYRVELQPSRAVVFGRVLSRSAGNPIAGAIVLLQGEFLERVITTATDSLGEYRFEFLPNWSWTIAASADGYKRQLRTLVTSNGAPDGECSFALDDYDQVVELEVIDAETGLPVTAAVVRTVAGLEQPVTASGHLIMREGPELGDASWLFVSALGYSTALAKLDWSDSRPSPQLVRLSRTLRSGLVIENPTEFGPWEGMFRQAVAGGRDAEYSAIVEAERDGTVTVSCNEGSKEGGPVWLYVSGPDVRRERYEAREWNAATDARAALPRGVLRPGRTLRLRIVDRESGSPVHAAQCALFPNGWAAGGASNLHTAAQRAYIRAQADDAGAVEFDGMGDEPMDLYCSCKGFAPVLREGLTADPCEARTIELDRMTLSGSIAGSIRSKDRTPLTITAIGPFGERFYATVAADGTFRIPELPQAHEYRLNIEYEVGGKTSRVTKKSLFHPDGGSILINI